jgi:S-adenosylmethionine synthetase
MVKGTVVVLGGEITTKAEIDYDDIVRRVAKKLGYEVDEVIVLINTQSPEIAGGVDGGEELGAGDQGMMYGYATRETESRLPFGFDLANRIIKAIEYDVEHNPDTVFQGDAKCQVTVDLDAPPTMESVKKVLVSVCHKPEKLAAVRVFKILEALGVPNWVEVIVNPAGSWTIGGPAADCGLTGRKIVCDQYGGYCPVGGGAFSGKDPSKVDRSGAYMARYIARDLLDYHKVLKWVEVQIAYAIGQAEPMSVSVSCNLPECNEALTREVAAGFDLTPAGIIKTLDLLRPKYEELAEGCHYRVRG